MDDELNIKINKIKQVIDIDDLIGNDTGAEGVKKYYKNSAKAYSFFHSRKGYIHLGISDNGKFNKDDFKEAARIVDSYIKEIKADNVLELATGRGANTLFLATNNPETKFLGLDLSPGQLKYTKNINLKNVEFQQGDFHNLSNVQDESIDLTFVVESLCHSKDPNRVLKEVYRVLKSGGVFVVIDAYVVGKRDSYSDNEKLAIKLAERGMAVDEFKEEGLLLEQAHKIGYETLSNLNKSQQVIPTLIKTEYLAKGFFKYARLASLIKKIVGKDVSYNAVSGYLLRYLVEHKIASYFVTVLKKP